jgi:phage host-nuclease inhibitor protein Gam
MYGKARWGKTCQVTTPSNAKNLASLIDEWCEILQAEQTEMGKTCDNARATMI